MFLNTLASTFFSNPLIKHLLDQLDEKEWTRFGGMRTMMREACGGYDIVSREDVTRFTQNFYEWAEELDFESNFEFGVPRRSQLIRRRPRDCLTGQDIREMILDRRPTSEIKKVAGQAGMRFLRESAIQQVLRGRTTLREINKVTFVE